MIEMRAPVAQWIERRPPEPKVAGSNPVGRANAILDPRRAPPQVSRAGTTTSYLSPLTWAFVVILGFSRIVAARFATDKSRPTTLERIVRCVDDLGCATSEFLTDRDSALVTGSRSDGSPIYAPEWVDIAALLGTR